MCGIIGISSNKPVSINIINSDTIVSDEESPMTAVKNSKNTSMWNCIKHQLDGKSDISLSAGNTGVLLVISRMILKMMNEVTKPALAGLWPNQNGMNVVLDLGANIECNDTNLIDFAELGSALYKSLFPKDKPKGITSFKTPVIPPIIANLPILVNCCTAEFPPITTESSIVTCPPRGTLFAITTLFPILRSCAI